MRLIDWIYFLKIFGIFILSALVAAFGFWIRPYIIDLVERKYYLAKGKVSDKASNLILHIKREFSEKWRSETHKTSEYFLDFSKATEAEREIRNEEYKDKEFQKLIRKRNRLNKASDILREWFTFNDFTWKSCLHCIVGGLTYTLSALLAASLFGYMLFAIHDISFYKNWDKQVVYYELQEHPTHLQCKEAEEKNKEYKDCYFIKKEYLDSKRPIDTELLWAKFNKNVDTRKSSLHD